MGKHLRQLLISWLFIVIGLSGFRVQAVETPTPLPTPFPPMANDLAWSPDGSQLAIARSDGVLALMSASDQTSIDFNISSEQILSAAWNPSDANRLAISSFLGDVQVFEVSGRKLRPIYNLKAEFYINKVRWSPDGRQLATMGETGGGASSISRVHIWDNRTGELVATYEDTDALTEIAWNPKNPSQLLITGVADREGAELVLWDVSRNSVIWKVNESDSEVLSIAWNADATEFATTTELEDGLLARIHDASNGKANVKLSTGMMFRQAISWATSTYLAINDASQIQIWDTDTVRIVAKIQSSSFITTMNWSPDGSKIAYGDSDGMIHIVSLTDILTRLTAVPP